MGSRRVLEDGGVDHSRFAATFGIDPTLHEVAIATTVEWYRNRAARA